MREREGGEAFGLLPLLFLFGGITGERKGVLNASLCSADGKRGGDLL